MKIILFHQYFLGKDDPGGSRWNQFSKIFAECNEIKVMAGNIHYTTGKRIEKKRFYNKTNINRDITVYRTWTYSGYNTTFLGRLIGYFSYTFSSFIATLFIRHADLIIITSPPLFIGFAALILSRLKRIPFVFEVRDLWPESAIATGVVSNRFLISIMFWIEKMLYKHAAAIVTLTPAFKANILQRFPDLENKLTVITNGADFDLFTAGDKDNFVREKYGWGDKKVFSYFGAHGVANDLIQVLDVARRFTDDENVLFVLIGDGMQKMMLKEKVKSMNLTNIQFIDSVPKSEVGNYINASNVCMAILKKTDTFKTVYPNKVFDYMSCKKPVLVTIDGITRELVENSGAGFYAEPGNIDAFEETVLKFIRLPEFDIRRMGKKGYHYVKENFARNKLAAVYLNLLKNVGDKTEL